MRSSFSVLIYLFNQKGLRFVDNNLGFPRRQKQTIYSEQIMENQEKKEDTLAGKPFLLRPSALGSTAGAFGSSVNQQTKPSLLRPSKLTAIADQIENSSLEHKKRKADVGPCKDLPEELNEAASKKSKNDDKETNKSSKGLELNEQIVQPQGIGTFGFGKENDVHQNDKKSSSQPSESSPISKSVFGQNIHERVVGFQEIKQQSEQSSSSEDSAAANKNDSVSEEEQENRLAQNASEHMKKEESTKLHLQEVETVTGEEGERNVLQIQCKLHMFNKDETTWVEKGRGTIKLNDICRSEVDGVFQSRIVFRTTGSHLVVVNTLLWPEMCYDKAGVKNLRFSAIHPETKQVKIYLITAAPKDIIQIHTAIDRRIIALKMNQDDANANQNDIEASDSDRDACTNDSNDCVSGDVPQLSDQEPQDEDKIEEAKDSNFDSDSNNSSDSLGNET